MSGTQAIPNVNELGGVLQVHDSEDQWKAARFQGVTGTDCAAITGCNVKYETPYSLWMKKTARIESASSDESSFGPAYWGTQMEPLIRNACRQRHASDGWMIFEDPLYSIRRSSVNEWQIGTPDGHIFIPERGLGVWEAKTTNAYLEHLWRDGKVPLQYFMQVCHYMAVLGYEYAMICVVIGGQRYEEYFIERDEALIAGICKKEEEFWQHVIQDSAPSLDGHAPTADAVSAEYRESSEDSTPVVLPEESVVWDRQRTEAIDEMAAAKTKRQEAETRIKQAIGHSLYGDLPDGSGRFSWKGSPRRLNRTKV